MADNVVSKRKKKVKKWYPILAPESYGKAEIGHTFTDETSRMMGKKVLVCTSDLGDTRRESPLNLIFKVVNSDAKAVYTDLIGVSLQSSYIQRLTHLESRKITGSLEVMSKDNRKMRIKYVAITFKLCSTPLTSLLKKGIDEYINVFTKKNEFDKIINGVIRGSLSKGLKEQAHTTYPLQRIEIYSAELV